MNIKKYVSRVGIWRILSSAFFVAFGIFLFVYGGYDDSPGGQLLGLLIAAFGAWRLWRSKR